MPLGVGAPPLISRQLGQQGSAVGITAGSDQSQLPLALEKAIPPGTRAKGHNHGRDEQNERVSSKLVRIVAPITDQTGPILMLKSALPLISETDFPVRYTCKKQESSSSHVYQ